MTIFEPKSFLKNATSFWKKPAFEVNCCEAVISLPFAFLTALPFLSTNFRGYRRRALGDGFHAAGHAVGGGYKLKSAAVHAPN